MEIAYNPERNVAYIRFASATEQVECVRVSEDVTVDLDSEGRVYGIELLNANAQLRFDGKQELTFTNDAIGRSQTISLPS